MRIVLAAAMMAWFAGSAFAQQQPIPRYGEEDKAKTPQQKESDRAAERAYQNSLQNIPDKGPSDPWGVVRSGDAPKTSAAKPKAKAGNVSAKSGAPN
jgi:hypothetical protein